MPSAPRLELSSFSPSAQEIIRTARKAANVHRTSAIGTEDLLAGAAESDTVVGEVLRESGVTYGQVLSCCHFPPLSMSKRDLDEIDFPNNFDFQAKGVLARILINNTNYRKDPLITPTDIIEGLIGSDNSNKASYKTVSRLECDPSIILQTIARRAQVQERVALT